MRKLIILLALALAGCYGNYRHSNRMYDSSMLYYAKCRDSYLKANASLYGVDTGALHRSDSIRKIADDYGAKAKMYADSFDYYNDRRFEREAGK